MPSPAKWRSAAQRLIGACHEIGVLFIAFAPLDYALDQRPFRTTWPAMIIFLLMGFVLISLCIYFEWRIDDD